MTKAIRELFRAERKRLGLGQEHVAERGGASQSTISKIEIEPDYEPTVPVFEKAVRGLGMTLSSFFARIEGLSKSVGLGDNPASIKSSSRAASDEARASEEITTDERAFYRAIGKIVAKYAGLPDPRLSELDREQDSDRRREIPENDLDHRRSRRSRRRRRTPKRSIDNDNNDK